MTVNHNFSRASDLFDVFVSPRSLFRGLRQHQTIVLTFFLSLGISFLSEVLSIANNNIARQPGQSAALTASALGTSLLFPLMLSVVCFILLAIINKFRDFKLCLNLAVYLGLAGATAILVDSFVDLSIGLISHIRVYPMQSVASPAMLFAQSPIKLQRFLFGYNVCALWTYAIFYFTLSDGLAIRKRIALAVTVGIVLLVTWVGSLT